MRLATGVFLVVRAAVAAIVMASLLAAATSARAQTAAGIGPNPALVEIAAGQVATVTIVLDGARGAFGIDLSRRFDPNVIELVAAAPGAPLLPGGFFTPDFVTVNRIDNTAGTFQWVATQVNPSPPVNGIGPIVLRRGAHRDRAASCWTCGSLWV